MLNTAALAKLAATLYPHVTPGQGETRAGIAASEAVALVLAVESLEGRSPEPTVRGPRRRRIIGAREARQNARRDCEALGIVTASPGLAAREARALGRLGIEVTEASRADARHDRLVAEAAAAPVVTVREQRNYGPCAVMGKFIRETPTGFTYLDSEGRSRRSVHRRSRRFAGERLPEPHIKPCPNCPERRDPRACIHGRVGRCETCMST